MGNDQIRYDVLTENALRGVVRTVLAQVRETGLPGEHHFFIAFDTCAPDVDISERLKEQYPEEMTIVLQHQFWDMEVREDDFEIKLSFNSIPERLVVPFAAIKGFYDPSVQFGLQFDATEAANDEAGGETPAGAGRPSVPIVGSGQTGQDDETGTEPDKDGDQSADVVSLDTFRKK